MPSNLSKLSVDEIRERYARADEPISPQTLSKLKRDPRHGVRLIYATLKKRYERDSAERTRLDAMLNFERVLWRAGVQHIAGVDEVGMGPLAGPVIAAAVVFPPHTELHGIDDSKKLDVEQRVGRRAPYPRGRKRYRHRPGRDRRRSTPSTSITPACSRCGAP